MSATSCSHDCKEDEEEDYVLIDLDGVSGHVHIPPNAPYVLSGLDTMNPILIIDDKVKLLTMVAYKDKPMILYHLLISQIGEYEETIGTCLVFTEEVAPVVHEETGPSETNLFSGRCIIDPKQASVKEVKPIARLHKILKFRLLPEDDDVEDSVTQEANM
ncbi:uncharacterized protein LOC132307713 isoform X1 [Cornus florida]|uniref:uncharacterized protein LOC132307713 isoform X1 n=1 Tax=Cornus florida TaxID=4283 RepID=UPI0028A2686A|nr:uncharacterized protein LOC132307713 isoform X1 [Cornus florida]XP_059661530.1 uncharacterized protein LOC132307713 isoform X1 [Cornus florida]